MDTMAINANAVGDMQAAIESYCVSVEERIQAIKGDTLDNSSGFFGSQLNQINEYIGSTCTEINKIVRYFDEFKEKLADVQAAYEAKNASINTGDVAAARANDEDLVTVNRMN